MLENILGKRENFNDHKSNLQEICVIYLYCPRLGHISKVLSVYFVYIFVYLKDAFLQPKHAFLVSLYHTISSVNDPKGEASGKHCRRRKYLKPVLSPFPTMFSTLPKADLSVLRENYFVIYKKAVSLDQS